MKKLSILILTIPGREVYFNALITKLQRQINGNDAIEIITNPNEVDNIGRKRNSLLNSATGHYLCFIDDDDMVSFDYIATIMLALREYPDCLSLRGIMTTDGNNPEIFEHSLKYSKWRTTENKIKYERYPNHLNVINSDIAKQFKFPEINHGEDRSWSDALHASGLLKKEVYIDNVLYYYDYRSVK